MAAAIAEGWCVSPGVRRAAKAAEIEVEILDCENCHGGGTFAESVCLITSTLVKKKKTWTRSPLEQII